MPDVNQFLIKPLQVPAAPSTTEAQGIHQSDIILRTAFIAAIADLRANPNLLDYVWASLPRDAQTLRQYGELELSEAKKWFLATDFPVKFYPIYNEGRWPCISIKLVSSQEAETTLGDIHYIPQEQNDSVWPVLFGPFTPVGYNQATGIMTPPPSIVDTLTLATNQFVVDRQGRVFPITQVFDNGTFSIPVGSIGDFVGCVIKNERPAFVTQLESAAFREVYEIGAHVGGEPVYLSWLHSLVIFILLRYKQLLLEGRGLERTTFSSSDFDKNPEFETSEPVYSRFVTLTGYVRHYWPKTSDLKISTVVPVIDVADAGPSPNNVNINQEIWVAQGDLPNLKPKT